MTAASRPQVVTLRSGDVVRVRQVRPGDAPALARAYANLGEQSRYRRFFTVMPERIEKIYSKQQNKSSAGKVFIPGGRNCRPVITYINLLLYTVRSSMLLYL